MSLQSVPKKTVAILGGGITGLSTAYYLKQKCPSINPVILEKSPRLGGWVKTIYRGKDDDKFQYECGPRTVRPAGISGMNTLDLLEEIGMDNQVVYVTGDHTSAKNRFIYTNGKMVKLPTNLSMLYKTTPPFEKPLVMAAFRDLFKRRQVLEDDSIYNFVSRRFGEDVANYTIDPIIRGVCAGDSKEISVKFLMKQPFEFEQKKGSVVLGFLLNKLKERRNPSKPEHLDVGFSKIALSSMKEQWSVWTLEKGLQSLVDKLEDVLTTKDVPIHKNCDIKSVKLYKEGGAIEYSLEGETRTLECCHVISTIPAHAVGNILRPNSAELGRLLDTISSINVDVTNIMFGEYGVIPEAYEGFGFLVPSIEKSVPGLLGVVFDTSSFPQGDKTILTVMSYPQSNAEKAIKSYLEKTLKIQRAPDDLHMQSLKKCIPQYTLGHYERIQAIRDLILRENYPLSMTGASFDGVSVNDCIFGGKKVADNLANKIEQ